MSTTDEALAANQKYAGGFKLGNLAMPPRRRLAVLACMDARLTVERLLGLETGEAHIIRNAGGLATEDAIRSLIISHHLLGTREILIINHTDCGMLTFRDEDLRRRLEKESGANPESPAAFHAFTDLEKNVKAQIRTLRAHPWIPRDVRVRGCVYDVRTGKLSEVVAAQESHG